VLVALAAVGPGDQATNECLGEKLLVAVEPQQAPRARSDRQLAVELVVTELVRIESR